MNTLIKWQPTDQQRSVLEQLVAEAAKETSAAEFVKNYCDFGPSKWSKIMNAIDPKADRCYFDEIKDPAAEMESLAALLDSIPLKRAQIERLNSQSVLELSQFRAVAVAVTECMAKTSPERLVKYLAPTGGGKSMLCAYLARRKDIKARVLEVREAWRRSYFTVLQDIAKAVGARVQGENRPSAIEDRLVEFLSNQKLVLAMDEAEFFGSQAINGLKLLLNKTRLTLMVASIGEAHDRWNRYYPLEADQLTRRTHAIVELSVISPEDARLFFPDKTFKDERGALDYICGEASKFGHYSLMRRVATRLAGVERNTVDDVKSAVAAAQREMRRAPANTK